MYNCVDDYYKLFICNLLPRGPAETIFTMVEKDMRYNASLMKDVMLKELKTNYRFVHTKLIHELLDKYSKTYNKLYQMSSAMDRSMEDFSWYYIWCLAFDVQTYHDEETEDAKWHYYSKIILGAKAKPARIEAIKRVLE